MLPGILKMSDIYLKKVSFVSLIENQSLNTLRFVYFLFVAFIAVCKLF